jgi:cell pole-organizing protein PopZ
MAENKITYIQSSEHAIVGESGGQAVTLAPGGRVLFNEDAASHKYLRQQIEAEDPSVAHLSIVEVSPKQERAAEEERQKMLEKASEIAAEVRNEQAREASEQLEERLEAAEDQQPHSDPTDFPPQDEEAQLLAKQSGAGQRATTQADVAEEDQPKSGRRTRKSQ